MTAQGRVAGILTEGGAGGRLECPNTGEIGVVRGPGIANSDISLLKNIAIREHVKFQFGIETFNSFNHPQFEAIGTAIGSSTFGVVTEARDSRVMQARAKISW